MQSGDISRAAKSLALTVLQQVEDFDVGSFDQRVKLSDTFDLCCCCSMKTGVRVILDSSATLRAAAGPLLY